MSRLAACWSNVLICHPLARCPRPGNDSDQPLMSAHQGKCARVYLAADALTTATRSPRSAITADNWLVHSCG